MNDVLISTVGGLMAFWFWGTSDWLISKNSKHYDIYEVNLASRIVGLFVAIVLLLLNYRQITSFDQIFPFIIVAVLFVMAFNFMTKALTAGSVGIITPIVSTNPLITLLLALVLGGSLLSGNQLMSIMVIIGGLLLLSYQKNTNKIPIKELHKDTIYALISAILWGVAFYIVNQNVAGVPWEVVYAIIGIFGFFFALIMFVIKYRSTSKVKINRMWSNKMGLLIGLLQTSGTLVFFYCAGRVGNVLVLVVISAGAPLAASGLSAVFDHEKVGYVKRIGACLVVGGIILLNVLSS